MYTHVCICTRVHIVQKANMYILYTCLTVGITATRTCIYVHVPLANSNSPPCKIAGHTHTHTHTHTRELTSHEPNGFWALPCTYLSGVHTYVYMYLYGIRGMKDFTNCFQFDVFGQPQPHLCCFVTWNEMQQLTICENSVGRQQKLGRFYTLHSTIHVHVYTDVWFEHVN